MNQQISAEGVKLAKSQRSTYIGLQKLERKAKESKCAEAVQMQPVSLPIRILIAIPCPTHFFHANAERSKGGNAHRQLLTQQIEPIENMSRVSGLEGYESPIQHQTELINLANARSRSNICVIVNGGL